MQSAPLGKLSEYHLSFSRSFVLKKIKNKKNISVSLDQILSLRKSPFPSTCHPPPSLPISLSPFSAFPCCLRVICQVLFPCCWCPLSMCRCPPQRGLFSCHTNPTPQGVFSLTNSVFKAHPSIYLSSILFFFFFYSSFLFIFRSAASSFQLSSPSSQRSPGDGFPG